MSPLPSVESGPISIVYSLQRHNNSNTENNLPPSMYLYDLFAVVTHEGKLDNGHYWADVLTTSTQGGGGEWWHCDDDRVTPTTLKRVLAQKAYMLFYVKRSLGFGEGVVGVWVWGCLFLREKDKQGEAGWRSVIWMEVLSEQDI